VELVFLSLGSNIGDSQELLRSACDSLDRFLCDSLRSRLFRTQARYVTDQPDFLNMVMAGYTSLGPEELLDAIQKVETAGGRDRKRERFKGERPLDIDILLYGNAVIMTDRLVVPHPGLGERKFVLVPLLELDPFLSDPRTGTPLALSLFDLPDQGIYYYDLNAYNFSDSLPWGRQL
jgi:2-amino-4-hydroxy-6-hydroxymethyldihydropteridine diphosphokinase